MMGWILLALLLISVISFICLVIIIRAMILILRERGYFKDIKIAITRAKRRRYF
jgi:hypothetical protein